MPVISVIVPVYNTQKYLPRCIESILSQTFADFELILIDDGSTDASGRICDAYAARDQRILVLHQENKGQAAARNAGLDWIEAHSESRWIAFVDSDDWVDQRYFELLLNAAHKSNSNISICGYLKTREYCSSETAYDIKPVVSVWDAEAFFCEHTMEATVLWGKLYRVNCFRDIRFPDVRMFEDSCVTYKIHFSQREIGFINLPLYTYFQRDNSVMRKQWNPDRLCAFDIYRERMDYCLEHGLKKAYETTQHSYIVDLYNQIISASCFPEYKAETKKMRKMLRSFLMRYGRSSDFDLKATKKYYYQAFPLLFRIYSLVKKQCKKILFNFKRLNLRIKYRLPIMTFHETIQYVQEHKCSVARFGDGEFGIMFNSSNIGFQRSSSLLREKLTDTFSRGNDKLLICIPGALNSVAGRKKVNSDFWIKWGVAGNQKRLYQLIKKCYEKTYIFGNAQITRPYISFKSEKNAKLIFPSLKKLWNDRDLIMIEGQFTCLGVDNDLFSNAKSIKRIIAPEKNAFDCLERIIDAVIEIYSGELLIMALGPTATVLAAEFADRDMQALDLGHIDLEYNWFMQKAQEKVPVKNRYVNESSIKIYPEACDNKEYHEQIICRIN